MSRKKLEKAVTDQRKTTAPDVPIITGLLGIPLNGRVVEVPNRMGFVYVRLRNSQSEVIQAFNNQVSPTYNLPVKVIRQDNKYVILGVDESRYQNNWTSFAPFLPRHGNTHSFDIESGGGADIVWVYPRQFMPLLAFPSGSEGGPNVIVSSYTLQNSNGTWKYVGNTGSPDITPYNPTSATGAVMGLVFLDTVSGNPQLLINSGSMFSNAITGSSQLYPYIPTVTSPATQIPIVAVRLITGTSQLSWDNLYDVRQFIHAQPTGSGGGLSSIAVQEEGVAQGNATTFNFVGAGATASVAGDTATITIPGGSGSGSDFVGDPMSVVLTNGTGTLYTAPWLKWGTDNSEYMEFGADEIKESNAGKIGYNVFSDTMPFFHIVGAGTGTSTRRVKIFDELYIDRTGYAREFNILDPSGQYMITGSPHKHTSEIYTSLQQLPKGTLINGMIHPTVSSGALSLSLKTWAGQDPSASDSVYVRIGNTARTISAPLSVTLPTGTSLMNLGSAELATKEVDLFAYLIWDSNSAAVAISCSRIPYGALVSDFSATTTDEKHLFNYANFTTTDDVELIGRFAATLSASPFVWTVPTYNNSNLIRKPIYETRLLSFATTITPQAGSLSSIVRTAEKYQVVGQNFNFDIYVTFTTNSSAPAYIQFTVPFSFGLSTNFSAIMTDGSSPVSSNVTSSGNSLFVRRYDAGGFTLGASRDVRMRFSASMVA